MFQNATLFDQNVSSFDTSNVVDLAFMFQGASSFTNGGADLLWNVERVTDMRSLFEGTRFAGDLSAWNTAKVGSFARMFANNLALEDPKISNWNTANATDMWGLFDGCVNFRGDVSNWDTSKVADMAAMFRGASTWTSNINGWNTASCTDMSHMFEDCAFFNRDLEGWETQNVKSMAGQFRGASSFFGLISSWNTGKVKDFSYQFDGASKFDGAIAGWDLSSAKDMTGMFRDASSFNRDLSSWKVEGVLDMPELFLNAANLEQSLCWNLDSRVDATDMFVGSQACFDPNCVDEDMLNAVGCGEPMRESGAAIENGGDDFGVDTQVSKQEREQSAAFGHLRPSLVHGLVGLFTGVLFGQGWF